MRNFAEAILNRRTIYSIDNNVTVAQETIISTIEHLTREVPSSFNNQSARVVVLFGKHHDKVWNIVMETLRKLVPPENFPTTEAKVNGFAAGYGTVLYFDDTAVTNEFAEKFPSYSENFPIWANQSNGMLQFAIWTALSDLGLGVNLQHYNPIIDNEVKAVFNIPDSWKLIAQMPFGNPLEQP
ncbi:MAG: nitroreductase, partial [Massilibacillus sp.]|nr:nitroreductase [Massilibacillus sp.]